MNTPHTHNIAWRSRLKIYISLLLLVAVIMTGQATPAYATGVWELPTPTEEEPLFVLDEGDVLSPATEGALNQASKTLAKDRGFNVHTVTVHRLDYGETADSLAQQILTEWYPDAEVQANQAIFVVDTVTNGGALQLGQSLKAALPEAVATSIVQENLAQPLRQNRYNQALQNASDRLIAVLAGRPDPGAPKPILELDTAEGNYATAEETSENRTSSTIWVVFLLIAATVIPMATYYFYLFLQSKA
jgi:uncharacterized protein